MRKYICSVILALFSAPSMSESMWWYVNESGETVFTTKPVPGAQPVGKTATVSDKEDSAEGGDFYEALDVAGGKDAVPAVFDNSSLASYEADGGRDEEDDAPIVFDNSSLAGYPGFEESKEDNSPVVFDADSLASYGYDATPEAGEGPSAVIRQTADGVIESDPGAPVVIDNETMKRLDIASKTGDKPADIIENQHTVVDAQSLKGGRGRTPVKGSKSYVRSTTRYGNPDVIVNMSERPFDPSMMQQDN